MAEPIVGQYRLSRMLGAAVIAALLTTFAAPAVAPLGCGITWTRTGGVWIFLPDCSHQPPPAPPPPDTPPPGEPVPPEPPAAN
jgi:hypothetical protein